MSAAICIVNPFEHGGGAEYQINLLIEALAARGRYDIHYLAHFTDGPDRQRRYRIVRVGGGGPVPRLGYLADGPALYRTLAAIDPGVIYQRVACAYTGICALYARRRGVPLLWHAAHDTDVTPNLLDPGRNVLRVRLDKWAVAFGVRRATRVIVQTEHQADLLRLHFGRSADAVIPNFHPPAAELLDKSGPLTVMWIANLKAWKRPEVFVRLAQAFSGRSGIRFVMVGAAAAGGGNQRWSRALMQSVESTDNLEYLGEKSHREVNELLARAHVFVNTSTQEGFPNTFVQAWQRDVAVVSLSVDPDGVLERQRTGIAAHTEPQLADAVRRLLDEPALREEYIARGRQHAQQRHSLRNAADLIDLIDRNGGRPDG
jgi:glycosyltransferase involved in cell wall biosynthesis